MKPSLKFEIASDDQFSPLSLSGLQNRIYVRLILPGIKTLETQH